MDYAKTVNNIAILQKGDHYMKLSSKVSNLITWFLIFATVIVVLFSNIYIIHHADHECSGADCPVCAVIEMCENNIKNAGLIATVAVIALFVHLSSKKGVQYFCTDCPEYSLISQKVRINI